MVTEAALNAFGEQLKDLTLCKTRYDLGDLQWYTEGPFWRRTSMRFSRDYKTIPDYEIGNRKHGKTLEDILDESIHLEESLRLYKKTAHPEEIIRTDYLIEHVHKLQVRTRILLGEKMTFDQMTEGLYGLKAPEYDYRKFEEILKEMDQALPGKGETAERILDFREKLAIAPEKLLDVLKSTTEEFHRIAVENMNVTGNSMPRVRVRRLPDRNMVFLSILFGYDYNHLEYERNFNLLYPWTVDRVMEYIGHEMEPGHLTYFEKRLQTMIDTCWPEMAIVSQYSTSSAFTEGSARHAISMSFHNSMAEQVEFEKELIFKKAGIDCGLAELMPLWHRFCEIAGYGKLEVTRKIWDGVWSPEDGLKFLDKYGFMDRNSTAQDVATLMDDTGHFVAHDYARDVVKDYFQGAARDVKEQWVLYEQLCCSHVTMGKILDHTMKPDFFG